MSVTQLPRTQLLLHSAALFSVVSVLWLQSCSGYENGSQRLALSHEAAVRTQPHATLGMIVFEANATIMPTQARLFDACLCLESRLISTPHGNTAYFSAPTYVAVRA